MHSGKTKGKAEPLVGIVCTVLSVLLIAGVLTFAGPCAHEDGSVGSCLWAQRAVLGVGIVLLILSVVRVLERDEGERRGLSLSIALLGLLAECLPGVLIDLCDSPTMRCVIVMRPFTMVVGTTLAIVGAADIILRLRAIVSQKG